MNCVKNKSSKSCFFPLFKFGFNSEFGVNGTCDLVIIITFNIFSRILHILEYTSIKKLSFCTSILSE